jgi:hypothetical protein
MQDEERRRQLLQAQYRRWCESHGKLMRPPKLSAYIQATVRMWFDLVDDDGSGTLEHHELMAALQVGTWTVCVCVCAALRCRQCVQCVNHG